MTRQERQWRKEEQAEWQASLEASFRHREDCLCRAVREDTGPACYQKVEK